MFKVYLNFINFKSFDLKKGSTLTNKNKESVGNALVVISMKYVELKYR